MSATDLLANDVVRQRVGAFLEPIDRVACHFAGCCVWTGGPPDVPFVPDASVAVGERVIRWVYGVSPPHASVPISVRSTNAERTTRDLRLRGWIRDERSSVWYKPGSEHSFWIAHPRMWCATNMGEWRFDGERVVYEGRTDPTTFCLSTDERLFIQYSVETLVIERSAWMIDRGALALYAELALASRAVRNEEDRRAVCMIFCGLRLLA